METRSNIEFAFCVDDMTSLRYAIPFIKFSKKLLDVEVKLIYNSSRQTGKYNCITTLFDRFKEIIKENDIQVIDASGLRVEVKRLFCVENVVTSGIVYDKCYSFQHGFDYTKLAINNKQATYLMTDEIYAKDVKALGAKALVQPIPVNYWDWDYHVSFIKRIGLDEKNKSVLLFYPESGLIELFGSVYDKFIKDGYATYVKQRKKNQTINQKFRVAYYDEVWYPSESTFLTMLADSCVGFGTSAYVDTLKIHRKFIDFAVPDYSKNYPKPVDENFTAIFDDYSQSVQQIDITKTTKNKLQNPCLDIDIQNFLNEVLILKT